MTSTIHSNRLLLPSTVLQKSTTSVSTGVNLGDQQNKIIFEWSVKVEKEMIKQL